MGKVLISMEFVSEIEVDVTEEELELLKYGGKADLEEVIINYGLEYKGQREADLVDYYFKEKE